jgi:hypothetical protein
LRQSIDDGLRTIAIEGVRNGRQSIDALVGLRRTLFSDAPPPDDWRLQQFAQSHLPLAAE